MASGGRSSGWNGANSHRACEPSRASAPGLSWTACTPPPFGRIYTSAAFGFRRSLGVRPSGRERLGTALSALLDDGIESHALDDASTPKTSRRDGMAKDRPGAA